MIDRQTPGPASSPASAGTPASARSSLWHKLIGNASLTQQRELLELARRQGVLYTHQVPANGNGVPPERGRLLLASFETPNGLESVRPSPLQPFDGALDEFQRDAVARALATPDVCLIQGWPGTGKSRCVTELVLQSARLGQRILLTAHHAAALDGVVEPVASHESVFAVRCLEPGEKLDALPALIQALTAERRLRDLREDDPAKLQQEAEGHQAAAQRVREQHAVLARCHAIVEQDEEAARLRTELAKQREAVGSDVEQWLHSLESVSSSAGPLAPALEARRQPQARIEPALADVRGQQAERRKALERLETERQPLQALADAARSGRWWTAGWWQARLADLSKLDAFNNDRQRIESELADLAAKEERWRNELQEVEVAYRSARQACGEAEIRRRQCEWDTRLAVLASQDLQRTEEWQSLMTKLERPVAREAEALRLAGEACQCELNRQEERASLAKEWLDCLAQHGQSLAGWLAASANLVAMPLTVIGSDPHFGETARPGLAFDLAIVEEAQRLTEADFVKLARRARRLVLVADTELDPCPSAAASAPKKQERSQPTPTLFQRLWQRLHSDPRRLPYAWLPEDGRLCCQLRPCPPEQRTYLESERLDDHPDIELRILTPPRTPPALAEVVFPATMSIGQAKEYIYRELQELPVHASGHSFRWQDEADRLMLRLSDSPVSAPVAVALEPGVREMVGGPGPASTCCIEFEKQAGWDRPRAEEWVRQHLGVRDVGRTVRLDQSYRMEAELAAVIADLLFAGGYRIATATSNGNGNGNGAAVEFVAVPPAPPVEKPAPGRKIATASRGRLSRNGAGLELDLADPRQRSRLPEEVRGTLPSHGVVNYFEAQAVVRKLEALAKNAGREAIGVLALYPAQAALIRTLAQQSPALRGLDLVIGTPEAFRQRESAVMLVSLTRSHTNRAVPYGDGPAHLTVALTRARHQLILFGDPGTLARRCQWDKAVDHLDEPTAAREREVVTRLCDYLQGKGAHARAFHLDEGIGP